MSAKHRIAQIEASKARRGLDEVLTAELHVFKELGFSSDAVAKVKTGVKKFVDSDIQLMYARYLLSIKRG